MEPIDFFNIDSDSIIRKSRWIGLIFHTLEIREKGKPISWMMRRGLLINQELEKHHYKLLCFTPPNVNLNDRTVTGYMIENEEFKKICMPIPVINCEFYFGKKEVQYYRDFAAWAMKHGYEIYPKKNIAILAADKLLTAKVLSEYDESIVPKTSEYREDPDQLKQYLQKNNRIFIKPRFGSLGNGIFVIKKEGDQYLVNYYKNAIIKSEIFKSLPDCISYIKENAENRKYIIQEAVDVIQYQGSIFDLRVIMFSDENSWNFLSKVRSGKKSSELSNIHQGGEAYITESFLEELYSKNRAPAILQKIKNTATNIMGFLENRYGGINELALDIIIDNDENLYIAELNTLPGLIGDPKEYTQFSEMSEKEKNLIKDLANKNGAFLAKSLINRYRIRTLDPSPINTIGLIFQERIKIDKNKIYGYMYQAFALEHELLKHNYRLFCYSPHRVNLKEKTAGGFIIENGKLIPITLPIPKLNFDYHFRSASTTEKQLQLYKNFEPWALKQGYEIYPPKAIRQLTRDKLKTAEILSEYDSSIVPKTERFTGETSQIEKYVQKNHWAFIKPRFGRKGNDIFIIKKEAEQYFLQYYYKRNKNSMVVNTLQECLPFIKENMKQTEYIIQEAIECLAYEGSILDIRTVIIVDNKNSHCLSELIVGKKGDKIANLFQDARTYQLKEFLPKVFPQDQIPSIIQKIKNFSIRVAQYLNTQYNNQINEIAFDLLIDKNLNIYVAELNAKPGLVGMPMHYSNFYDMTKEEKHIYENVTLKHAAYLAQSLLNRSHLKPLANKKYWFKDITSAGAIEPQLLAKISELIFNAISQRILHIETLPELQSDCEPRIIFLSISDHASTAKTYMGSGKGLLQAIHSALECTKRLATTFNLQALKVDIVQNVFCINNHPIKKPLNFDRSLYGIAFDENIGLTYLPEEVVAYTIINNENFLRSRSIIKASHVSTLQKIALTENKNFTLYQFSVQSHFKSITINTLLFRGHQMFSELNTDLLLSSAISAGNYLKKAVQPDGKFLYEYLPKIDEPSQRYNILRHAGSIYAMLELYEVTKDELLLKSTTLALTHLLHTAESVRIQDEELICIVENDYVKLGANALTLLALTKYISITNETSFINTAKKLALWMKFAQSDSGNFEIHKQKFSNKKKSHFISEYYPGEAIFSLVSFYKIDPNPLWLEIAQKAANYIINFRDNNLTLTQLTHDHWLLYGLNELYRYQPNPAYIVHSRKICQAIINAQYRKPEPRDYLGSFYIQPRATPAAVRAEGMCAAYHLLHDNHYYDECAIILEAIKRCLRFQLASQYRPERSLYLPNPQRTWGGFSRSLTDYSIRIDYVQHNLSSLLGLYKIIRDQRQG